MNLHPTKLLLFVFIFLLSACAKQEHDALPTTTAVPPTEAPAATPLEVRSNTDPSLFGALYKSEIDPLAGKIHEAVFIKVMDGFIVSGNILDYQIIASEVFPSSDGTLIAEIIYNVLTTDDSWLLDGGTQVENNWITNKCDRFDFVNTQDQFQLKNRRTCN
jgi:hypothetical protein